MRRGQRCRSCADNRNRGPVDGRDAGVAAGIGDRTGTWRCRGDNRRRGGAISNAGGTQRKAGKRRCCRRHRQCLNERCAGIIAVRGQGGRQGDRADTNKADRARRSVDGRNIRVAACIANRARAIGGWGCYGGRRATIDRTGRAEGKARQAWCGSGYRQRGCHSPARIGSIRCGGLRCGDRRRANAHNRYRRAAHGRNLGCTARIAHGAGTVGCRAKRWCGSAIDDARGAQRHGQRRRAGSDGETDGTGRRRHTVIGIFDGKNSVSCAVKSGRCSGYRAT